jgi:hypothetical protein
MKRLERLSISSVWRGSNDPIRFYAAEYGKAEHRSLYSGKGCVVPSSVDGRARFPGSGHTDPDCINAEKCEVWEFKPESPTGRKEGAEQKEAYIGLVAPYYTKLHRAKEDPPDFLGGKTVMKTLEAKCLDGYTIELSVDVHYYKMCDKKYECISD